MSAKLRVQRRLKAFKEWPISQVWIYSLLGILVFTITSSRRIAYYDFNYIQNSVYRMTLGEVPFRDFDLVLPAIPYVLVLLIHFLMSIPINVSVYFATCLLIVVSTHSIVGIHNKLHKEEVALGKKYRSSLLFIFCSLFGVVSIYPNYVYDSVASAFALAALNQFLGHLNEEKSSYLFKSGIFISLSTFSKYNMGGFLAIGLLLTLFYISIQCPGGTKRKFLERASILMAPSLFTLTIFLFLGPMSIYEQTIVAASKFKNLDEVSQFAQYNYPALILILFLILVCNFRNSGTKSLSLSIILFMIIGISSVFIQQNLQNEDLDKILLQIFPSASFVFPIVMLLSLHKLISERHSMDSSEFCVLISLPLYFFGTFLSQGWDGSSYSLWPMLAIIASITVYSPSINQRDSWNYLQLYGVGVLILSLVLSIILGTRLSFVEDNGMRNEHNFSFQIIGTAISKEDLGQIGEVKNKITKSAIEGSTIVLPAEDSIESFGSNLLPWGRCLQYTMICPSFNERLFLMEFRKDPPNIVVIKHKPQIGFEIEAITPKVQKLVTQCYVSDYKNETYQLYLKKKETLACLKVAAPQ